MSALFHDKFEAALSKTTQELSDEVNKNKQRYQLLLKKFNGKVSTEMRVEFAQYKALELCHSIDTLVAQLKRDANFSDYKKRGAGTSAVFCSSCSLCIVRTANAASRAAAARRRTSTRAKAKQDIERLGQIVRALAPLMGMHSL